MKKLTITIPKIIFLIVSILIILNVIWLKIDTVPPYWDSAIHLGNINNYYSSLKSGQLMRFIGGYHFYPPLAYWISSLFFYVFGVSADIGVISLSFFLVILFTSAFLIGKDIQNEKLGLFFVLSLIGLPFLISQTREYQLDFPLTAMVLLCIYLLFKSNFLKIKTYSYWFAIASGFAFLTKWTYFPFFAFMTIFAFIKAQKKDKKTVFDNIILIFLITYFIAGWWYVKNFTYLKNDFIKNIQTGINEHDPSIFSMKSLLFYPLSLITMHLRLPLSILFFVCLWIIRRLKNNKVTFLLYLSLFYLITMILYVGKDHRFVEPITPLLVFVIVFSFFNIKNHFYKKIALIILIAVSLVNFVTATFYIKFLPQSIQLNLFNVTVPIYKNLGYTVGPPKRGDWHVEDIVDKYSSYKKILVVFSEDKMFFNHANFSYFGKLIAPKTEIKTVLFNQNQIICSDLINFDIIVINDNPKRTPIIKKCCPELGPFNLAETNFLLPDSSGVWIFKK
ncbi:MAG: glycosyltransferase family 39 protein [Patescibacteria group bacterium]|jgi:4-amino-4-deoxy-L-arabinose transferase-like glycosyltransferase